MTHPNLFVFGMGYSALASAKRLRLNYGSDISIAGTSRSFESVNVLNTAGFEGLIFDGTSAENLLLSRLEQATHLLISIAPGETGDPVLNALGDAVRAMPQLEWICYYSTVGVYGDAGGKWVDESIKPDPINKRSQWRVVAEDAWRDVAKQAKLPLTILRLAGIYGPGRSAFDKLRKGTAKRIVKPGQVFNRIHVEDIARVTEKAMAQSLDGVFNLADDLPAPPQDVVTYAAKLADMAAPPEISFDDADMTPMARSFYSDNKRVSNKAVKDALDFELVYPSYMEGIKAIWEETENG